MIQKLFDAHKVGDFKDQKIKMLWIFVGILLFLNLLIFFGFVGIKHDLNSEKLYVTPAEVTQGGFYQTNVIPPAIVYGFTYQIFVAINTWATNGTKDYQTNIVQYKYYLTPDYADYLEKDLKDSLQNGDLEDTVQTLSPYGTINDKDVEQVNDNTWIVTLPLRVTHYKDAAVILDAVYDYKVRVVRTGSSIQYNPWGLEIDGVVSKDLVKTLV
jgi:integrating conjugative element protein (TIGR03746 family)